MKAVLALFALILIPAAALAADAKAAPTVYEDTWLGIKYYDVADVLKYDGEDKELLNIKNALNSSMSKLKSGIVTIEQLPTYNSATKETAAFRIPQFALISKIGSATIKDHKSIESFLKTAKAQVYKVTFRGYVRMLGQMTYSIEEESKDILLVKKP